MDVDFIKLRSRTTIARQVWVAKVEMAISVAKVARGIFCTQETLLLLCTLLLKTSSHLRNKDIPPHTPSKHTWTTTLKQPGTMTPCHSACSARLSKSPYFFSRTHWPSSPLSKQTFLLPVLIRQPCNATNKTPWQVVPMSTPTTDLRPYDKICAHLHRLHTRIKASINQD